MKRRDLQTIPKFEAENPIFAGRVRWIRWRSQTVKRTRQNGEQQVVEELPPNGFAPAFVKVAGRVYVDPDKFFEIIEKQNSGEAA